MSMTHLVIESKPDFVFHLAAQSYPQTSFTAPLDTLDTNIQGTAPPARSDPTCEDKPSHTRLRVFRGVWPCSARKTADQRGVHRFTPASPYAHLESWDRFDRPITTRKRTVCEQ